MWHCLYAYCTVDDNVNGWSKLVPYGSIFILCSFFCCVLFLVAYVPMERVSCLGKKSLFYGIKVPMQLSFSTDIYAERRSICSHLDKVSSKSCKNVNCIIIAVFAVRYV